MAEPDDTRRPKGRGPKTPPEDPDETPGDRRLRVALIAITLGLGAMFVFAEFLPTTAPRLAYYEFKTQVRSGRVVEVLIGERVIRGRYRGTAHTESGPGPFARAPRMDFETVRVNDPQLIPLLDERQVRYGGMLEGPAAGPWMMTILGLLALTLFGRSLMKRFQGQTGSVLAFGRNKGRAIADDEVKVRFDDVAGVDEAKEELREVVEFLKNPDKFTRIGARIPKGVLLVGPPGTGKTLLARAVAGEAGVAFFSLSGSEFVEMFVGVGAARVRDLFENAKNSAPCIVFIDELDALGRARGANMLGTNEEREQTLNQLLVEMDGFETNKGVILLAATNRPEILDAALLRPGRFDRQVLVDRPDRKGREAILRVHAKQVKMSTELDFDDVASRTPGFAGADLANVVNEAALLAARRDRAEVTRAEVEEAIERVSGGLERRSRIISPEERQRVAYHEVGHAIVGQVLPGGARVAKISVVPRGVAALGYTMKLPTEDRYLTTESELRAQLAGLLGGRVAEQLVFGEASTGAGNDLQRATDLARAMVAEYGMSSVIGPVTVAAERSPLFSPTEGAGRMREHGEHLADTVDAEVKRLVEQAEATAREILSVRRPDLDRIARALIEHEYLDGAQFRAMLEGPAADVPSAGVPPVAELP